MTDPTHDQDTAALGAAGPAPFAFPIERGKVAEFARAIWETSPVFLEPEAVLEAGFGDIPVPLTYPVICRFFQRPGNEARHGLDMRWTVHAEQEFEYQRLPLVGETLTVRQRLGERREKVGRRGGRLIFQDVETTFEDAQGQRVLLMRQTLVQTEGPIKQDTRSD